MCNLPVCVFCLVLIYCTHERVPMRMQFDLSLDFCLSSLNSSQALQSSTDEQDKTRTRIDKFNQNLTFRSLIRPNWILSTMNICRVWALLSSTNSLAIIDGSGDFHLVHRWTTPCACRSVVVESESSLVAHCTLIMTRPWNIESILLSTSRRCSCPVDVDSHEINNETSCCPN
jgi:hypothetical protein